MATFLSEYECRIDPKGRFLFPADALKKLSDLEQKSPFVVLKGLGTELRLYTFDDFTKYVASKLEDLNPWDEDDMAFKAMLLDGQTTLALDPSNRMLLSNRLRSYAKLDKDVLLKGMGSYIEIWNPAEYDKHIAGINRKDIIQKRGHKMGHRPPQA